MKEVRPGLYVAEKSSSIFAPREPVNALGFTPLGDRVVIKADVESHAPESTESGLLTATTLAAAVDGHDTADSWFVGTIVALGPLVAHFDCRQYVLRRLKEIQADSQCCEDYPCYEQWCSGLIKQIQALPTDCPDPLHVGDRVTFSWSSGQQMTVDGDRYLIMHASDVLAVLNEVETVNG